MSDADPAQRSNETGAREASLQSVREVALQSVGVVAPAAANELGSWAEDLLSELSPESTSLAIRLIGADEMRRLNREYRSIDRPTDVLSFVGEDSPEERHLGDIAIALPVARRQAAENDHSLANELKVLVLHGVLHCLGHDHETDMGEMETFESELRSRWIPECSSRR